MDLEDLLGFWKYLSDDVKTLVYVSALVALALCIFFLPEKRRAGLGKALKAIHDFLNFKAFIIEKIFQFLYLTLSIAMVFVGIYALTEGADEGLLIAILGPVAVRILYEGIMLVIVLVKNVIQINRKLPENPKEEAASAAPTAPAVSVPPAAPAYESYTYQAPVADPFAPGKAEEPVAVPAAAEAQNLHFCTMCGAQYDKSLGNCPKCGY